MEPGLVLNVTLVFSQILRELFATLPVQQEQFLTQQLMSALLVQHHVLTVLCLMELPDVQAVRLDSCLLS